MNRPQPHSPIDWTDVGQRLHAAEQALADNVALPPEQLKALLEARACVLAAEPPPSPQGSPIEVLTFELAGERYGIETMWVRAVFPLRELTPVPGTPRFVLGVVYVRGRIVSLLDLRHVFDLPATERLDLGKVILLGDGSMEFGMLAEAIGGIQVIADVDWQAPLPTLTGIRSAYLKGITRDREVVLDAQKLLADRAMVCVAAEE
ncbi:chemotaxis protein CheW [Burkholderia sp. JP2-270]|uniref:chemotaxis protein CheW n=1 Tax=Burkholderia sp. JP2-270 TaxID=2217913 RepID=UPI000DA3DD90|nr:chemotaxis protein CheW [Burkholderia sp. JP2-270]AWV05072.1 chemotaxis protein CheW [Burkholderia sp. JP2-270]